MPMSFWENRTVKIIIFSGFFFLFFFVLFCFVCLFVCLFVFFCFFFLGEGGGVGGTTHNYQYSPDLQMWGWENKAVKIII